MCVSQPYVCHSHIRVTAIRVSQSYTCHSGVCHNHMCVSQSYVCVTVICVCHSHTCVTHMPQAWCNVSSTRRECAGYICKYRFLLTQALVSFDMYTGLFCMTQAWSNVSSARQGCDRKHTWLVICYTGFSERPRYICIYIPEICDHVLFLQADVYIGLF